MPWGRIGCVKLSGCTETGMTGMPSMGGCSMNGMSGMSALLHERHQRHARLLHERHVPVNCLLTRPPACPTLPADNAAIFRHMDRCVYRRVLQDDGRGHRKVKVRT